MAELATAVTTLLSGTEHDGPTPQLAARSEELAEQLTRHLARIVGEIGVIALFKRSVVLAGVAYPWLVAEPRPPETTPIAALRTALAAQPGALAREGFLVVLSTFVALLGRLIGEPLVRMMLREVWPVAFDRPKENE